jgi:hypothetical protein
MISATYRAFCPIVGQLFRFSMPIFLRGILHFLKAWESQRKPGKDEKTGALRQNSVGPSGAYDEFPMRDFQDFFKLVVIIVPRTISFRRRKLFLGRIHLRRFRLLTKTRRRNYKIFLDRAVSKSKVICAQIFGRGYSFNCYDQWISAAR